MIVAQGGWQAHPAYRFKKTPFRALSRILASPFLPFFANFFSSFRLRTLKLSCGYFSRSRPLFSITSALFDKKRGWPTLVTVRLCANAPHSTPLLHLPLESTLAKVYQNKQLQLSLESTLVKKRGRGGIIVN